MSGGREHGEEPAQGSPGRTPLGRAAEPDLAVASHRGHGLTAVAEGCLALGALDERHNAGVVFVVILVSFIDTMRFVL